MIIILLRTGTSNTPPQDDESKRENQEERGRRPRTEWWREKAGSDKGLVNKSAGISEEGIQVIVKEPSET